MSSPQIKLWPMRGKARAVAAFFHVIALVAFIVSLAVEAYASDMLADLGPSFTARFEQSIAADLPKSLKHTATGGTIIADGVSGKALRLKKGDYLKLPSDGIINPTEGILSLWVRPDWSDEEPGSHTFVSFGWNDGRNGYFSLSKGWWEPKGKTFFYFIANNQDYSHVYKLVRFDRGVWVHLACSWKEGKEGYIRLFVNGFRVNEGRPTAMKTGTTGGEIIVGCDRGTPLAKERWAESDFDEVMFFKKALNDDEIYRIYRTGDSQISPKPAKSQVRGQDIRAIFDEGTGWTTERGARETIERIKGAGFNVYIPCVWHNGGTRYPKEGLPPEKGVLFTGTDPLKRLIEIAHANGIEVHPWFCVALRQKEFLKDYYGPGTPKDAFDLHRPSYREFIIGLILDVIRRYDVDGINLDYIRTMGTCTCDFCVGDYRKKCDRDLKADLAKTEPDGSLNSHIRSWHDKAVEAIVREINVKAKKIRPGLVLSVDGLPAPYQNGEGRNEIKWANDGYVDIIYNMIYGRIPDFEHHHFMRRRIKNPEQLVILLANLDFVNGKPVARDGAWMFTTIDHSLRRWPGAFGIYLYSMLNDEQINALKKRPN